MLLFSRSRIKTPGKKHEEDPFRRPLGRSGRSSGARLRQPRSVREHVHLRKGSRDPGRGDQHHDGRVPARPEEEVEEARRIQQNAGQQPCQGLEVQ
jgi:hypothetical protein